MSDYLFHVIVHYPEMMDDEILNATDALCAAGCDDASLRGHPEGFELLFHRNADTLQAAISTAISDVESCGYRVAKVELEREAISV
jgi:hypothetical protein